MKQKSWIWPLVLFCITLITTTLAGAESVTGRFFLYSEDGFVWDRFVQGFQYSVPFLAILTAHEFGHYFFAKHYKASVTLPYYIPFWLGQPPFSIGTMGAFIRINSALRSRKEYFDVGIAGPLAGFVVAMGVIAYGFTHLPPPEYIFTIHPEYAQFGLNYADVVYKNMPEGNIVMGDNLIFWFFRTYIADPTRMPNQFELMHYPLLSAGYIALFFTAMNLIPIGQLDGGHILYGLIGHELHKKVASVIFVLFIFYAGLDLPYMIWNAYSEDSWTRWISFGAYLGYLIMVFDKIFERNLARTVSLALAVFILQVLFLDFFPKAEGYTGWLVFGLLISKMIGIGHPPAPDNRVLDTKRKVLGWLTLLIFLLCFSPKPFIVM
jgi:membrane-associated protease RseP (regulator of RpoE activity)